MNTKLTERFVSLLKELPEEELLLKAKAEKQKKQWFLARQTNEVAADCFYAKSLERDDPIADWEQDKETKIIRELIWQIVVFYDALWNLIEISFKDIREQCEALNLSFPFDTDFGLFSSIVKVQENSHYAKCLEPSFKLSVGEGEKTSKLLRQKLWGGLSEEDEQKLKQLTKEWVDNFWFLITYGICLPKKKTHPAIANKLIELEQTITPLADLYLKICSESRKGRIPYKVPSVWWIDGEVKKGQRHGGKHS